jgi:hypothetical protein
MHHQYFSVAERVMEVVTHNPGCLLEDVALACSDLSWNQVFSEVDRLSRIGQIRLMREGFDRYALSVPGYERMEP